MAEHIHEFSRILSRTGEDGYGIEYMTCLCPRCGAIDHETHQDGMELESRRRITFDPARATSKGEKQS